MCTHIDDLCFGGTETFLQVVIEKLKERFKIGEEECRSFKYIGVNILQDRKEIVLSQDDYLKKVITPDKRRFKEERGLNREEQTEYRALVGKMNWICQHTRPDLAFLVSYMSKWCREGKTEI